MPERRFKIAFSFPEEHRELVKEIVDGLRAEFSEEELLYDKFHRAEFARPNLDTYLQTLYGEQSDLIVVFACAAYETKPWCGIEWRAIRNLLTQRDNDDRIMFIKCGEGKVSGVFGTIDGYIDAQTVPAHDIMNDIRKRYHAIAEGIPQPVKPSNTESSVNISGNILEGIEQHYCMRRMSKITEDQDAELKDYLEGVLHRDKDEHPSFVFMKSKDESDDQIEMPDMEVKGHICGEIGNITVSQAILKSWEEQENHSIVITGEGGSGKTVALFNTSVELLTRYRIPAIYIPLYRLVNEKRECLSVSDYLKERFTAKWNIIEQLAQKEWDHGPTLMLLLDGFNEIPGEKRRIVLKQINEWSKTHPGTQLIAVSRPMDGLNLGKELTNSPLSIELEELDEEQIRAYLKKVGRRAPENNSPIWAELAYPHFLMLYIKTNALNGKRSAGYPLRPKTMKSGGALIWNFLQRELLRQDDEEWVLRCAIACEYILPFIAYQMVCNYSFTVDLDQALTWIDEAIVELRGTSGRLPAHLSQLANTYKKIHYCPFSIDSLSGVNWRDVVLQETGLLISKEGTSDFSFTHQNFRDCLAALYLVNHVEIIGDDLPGVWKKTQDNNTLNYISELLDMKSFESVWETNRQLQPTDHVATVTLLEILVRKKQKELIEAPPELNFSGMDLRDMSLVKYLRKEAGLNLFEDSHMTSNTILNIRTFLNAGHTSFIVCIGIMKDGRIVSGSWDDTLRIWDPTTGECLQVLEGHSDSINCIGIMKDECIVSGSLDHTLRIWDSTTGECLQVLEGHSGTINCIGIMEDGRIVSGSWDDTLRIWDSTTGECLQVLEGNSGTINCIGIMEDGRIVDGSYYKLHIWNSKTGKCIKTLHFLETNIDWRRMNLSCADISHEAKESLWQNGVKV